MPNLLQSLLSRRDLACTPADGIVEVRVSSRAWGHRQPRSSNDGGSRDSSGRSGKLLKASNSTSSPLKAALGLVFNPFAASRPTEQPAADGVWSFGDLPAGAAGLIFSHLSPEDRRAVRLVSPVACSTFSRAISSLQVSGREVRPGDVSQLSSTFPDLSSLQLSLGAVPDASSSSSGDDSSPAPLLQELRGLRMRHLHTFSCDVKLRGDGLLAVARFLVHTPSLTVLRLPNQRGSSPADQRLLCAVVEALPNLTELDLGGVGGAATAGAVSPSLLRRITRLLPNLLTLRCNAAGVPPDQLLALSRLHKITELSISATGSACGWVRAVKYLVKLTTLELQHPSLGAELVGCLGGLVQLRVLALGLCPEVPPDIMNEVSALGDLQRLALPFALGPPQLRCLSKLPSLTELLCWRELELDALGLAHEPLAAVKRLVVGSINGHGQPLSDWCPVVNEVVLRACSDMDALSLRACPSLSVLVAEDCSALSDHGLAALKDLRSLQRLQIGSGSQLTDASFAVVFSRTMPALQHIMLWGCPGISDTALQHLTASCRRLATISIASCRQLTDKTLKRLAHCEHLCSITLRGCRRLTAEGVAALAAAPQVKAVSISGCSSVRKSQCKGLFRAGVRVRIDSSRG